MIHRKEDIGRYHRRDGEKCRRQQHVIHVDKKVFSFLSVNKKTYIDKWMWPIGSHERLGLK